MIKKISVVMATYNGAKYLRQAIDSVLAQTYKNFEFIVIDDASTDETKELLADYAFQNSDVFKYLTLPQNAGQGDAFNRGIAETNGEIVSFIDSDDYWYPHKLETVAKDFGDPKKVAIHQHHLNLLRDGEVQSKTVKSTLFVGDMEAYSKSAAAIQGNFVPTSGLSISRYALKWVGPIPSQFRICADGYLTRTAMCYGRLSASDAALGAYRIHDSNHTAGNVKWDNGRYVNQLLIPQLHTFYEKRAIGIRYIINEGRYEDVIKWLGLKRDDHVMVMRVAPYDIMLSFLKAMRDVGVCTHLLAPERMKTDLGGLCFQFYGINDGMIGAHTLSDELADKLRILDLKYVLLPYVMPEEQYTNVQQAVLSMSLACPSAGISTAGNIIPFKPVDKDTPGDAVSLQAEENAKRLLAIRDKYKGQRAFLIGNGPSLTMADLDRLKDEITIASNKIYLAFPETHWRPTVYCVCDDVVARNNHDAICELPFPKVFTQPVMKYLWDAPLASYMPPKSQNTINDAEPEQWNLVQGCNAGHSVLNMSIKIACWMGIREIYIIGADHNFVVPDTQTGERIMNNEVIRSEGEKNHFHPDYRQKGEEWTIPKLDEIENDFKESGNIFKSLGGEIWNASRFTKLNVFDRVDLDEVLRITV